jgi:dienelactone hydrolase
MRASLVFFGLACCVCYAQQAPEKVLWGSLSPGPYAVGFQAEYQIDPTRAYDTEYSFDARAARAKKPRPIFIAWWYPAQPSAAPRLAYRDYLDAVAPGPSSGDFARRLAAYNHEVACAEVAGKSSDDLTSDELDTCQQLLSIRTYAVRDAKPAGGRFPVVFYHAGLGGSYEDNAVLCEYLASHGYVVLSSAYQNADSTILNISWDLDTTFGDRSFLLRFAATLPFADTARLAAVGHSFGAQASLAWHAEPNSPLDATVVLDTTVEYGTLDWPGFAPLKLMLTDGRHGSAPVLLFATRSLNPRFDTFDSYLKFAPRYEATLEHMEHNDYISHGAVGKTLRLGTAKAAEVRRNYDLVCLHVRRFLDAYVKQDGRARAGLDRAARWQAPGAAIVARYRAPRPLPPTGRQILALLDREGPAKTRELLQSVQADLDRDALLLAGRSLSEARRNPDALTIYTWASELFPQSAQVHQVLGDFLKAGRATSKARHEYERALALVPVDPDLTDPERDDARGEIQEALDELEREQ